MWAFLYKLLIQLVVSFVVARLTKSGDQGFLSCLSGSEGAYL